MELDAADGEELMAGGPRSRHVTSRHVTSRHVTSRHATPSQAKPDVERKAAETMAAGEEGGVQTLSYQHTFSASMGIVPEAYLYVHVSICMSLCACLSVHVSMCMSTRAYAARLHDFPRVVLIRGGAKELRLAVNRRQIDAHRR